MNKHLSTKEKILAAAKLHFAEHGLQHASVRTITKLAGVNSALLRYHFGSKAALYREVVKSAAASMIESRMDELNHLRDQYGSDPIPVAKLIEAYARPVLNNFSDKSRDAAIYLRLFGRMFTEPSDELRDITQSQFTETQKIFINEISKSVPYVNLEELGLRFGMMIGSLTFLGAGTGVIEILTDHKLDTSDEELTLPKFVEIFTGVFQRDCQ